MEPTYNLYDINLAFNKFIERYGVEPNGVLMNEDTVEYLKSMMNKSWNISTDSTKITFNGKKIFRSNDIEANKIRFVI